MPCAGRLLGTVLEAPLPNALDPKGFVGFVGPPPKGGAYCDVEAIVLLAASCPRREVDFGVEASTVLVVGLPKENSGVEVETCAEGVPAKSGDDVAVDVVGVTLVVPKREEVVAAAALFGGFAGKMPANGFESDELRLPEAANLKGVEVLAAVVVGC